MIRRRGSDGFWINTFEMEAIGSRIAFAGHGIGRVVVEEPHDDTFSAKATNEQGIPYVASSAVIHTL